MKTYILRPANPVERQTRRTDNPAAPGANVQAAVALNTPALFIGLDVHSDSVAVCLAPSDSTELRPSGVIGGHHDDVLKLLKKLSAAHPHLQLNTCYEAGPHGWPDPFTLSLRSERNLPFVRPPPFSLAARVRA